MGRVARPGHGRRRRGHPHHRRRTATIIASRSARIDPYYLFTRLPGATKPSFILLRPFAPKTAQDDNQVLTAFMVGKSDPADYGKLKVYVMPRQQLPNGPALVQGEIQRDQAVSQARRCSTGRARRCPTAASRRSPSTTASL